MAATLLSVSAPTKTKAGLSRSLHALWQAGKWAAVVAVASCGGDGGPTPPSGPQPLGPGTYFLFSKPVPPDEQHLFIMRSDGSGLRELSTGTVHHVWFAALAPDHSRAAFTDGRGVYLLRFADERVDTVLTDPAPLLGVDGLAWSPDSRRLAVAVERNTASPYGLFILSGEGEVLDSAPIHPLGILQYSPFVWSPDGQRVAYSATTIWTRRLDGSDEREITQRVGYSSDESPRYSPDGTKITFVRLEAACKVDLCSDELMVVDTSGANLRWLTSAFAGENVISDPAWSPDGSMIAYYHNHYPFFGIRVLRMDGSVANQIPVPEGLFFLDWR